MRTGKLSEYVVAFKRTNAESELAYDESKIPRVQRVPEWFRALFCLFNAQSEDWQRTLVVLQTDLNAKPWELKMTKVEQQLRAIA